VMFGINSTLCSIRRPVAKPLSTQWFKSISTGSPKNPKDSNDFPFRQFMSRFRALFSPQLFNRLSSYSLCHILFRQHQNYKTNIWLTQHIFAKQYLSLYHLQFARFFTQKIPNSIPAALAVAALSVHAESKDDEVITDDLMSNHKQDLDFVKSLIQSTLTCETCHKRHLIDQKVEGTEYCQCKDRKPSVYGTKVNDEAWMPFLERKDILVWRQEHPEMAGMYAYKMYGKFDDITADEFLALQLDTSEFRLSWDPSTAQCHVIKDLTEQDAKMPEDCQEKVPDSREMSHIYYWEVNWPRFFSNRDYVCGRRCKVYKDENGQEEAIVIFSKSTQHRNWPKKTKAHRVENYWSVLTIKPFTSGDQNGLEFSLTGFENPGISLPSAITTWIAIQGMPDFFTNLRNACIKRRKWLKKDYSSEREASAGKEPSYLDNSRHYSEGSRNYA